MYSSAFYKREYSGILDFQTGVNIGSLRSQRIKGNADVGAHGQTGGQIKPGV